MKSSLCLPFVLTASIALAGHAVAENAIPAQPIGLLDKKSYATNNEQDNFYYVRGPKTKNTEFGKVLFTAKVKTLRNGDEQHALFAQTIEGFRNDQSETFYKIDAQAPLKKLATYTVREGTQFDSFLYSFNQESEGRVQHFPRLYFHVPGKGVYVSEGGGVPKILRPENSRDESTKIIAGAVRRPYCAPDGADVEEQSRFFFAAKDAKKGREVFISAGTAKTTKLLQDLNPAAKAGSDPDQFCTVGTHNPSQRVFFSAKNPDDANTYQLWTVSNPGEVRGKAVYEAAPFTTGLFALAGKPENLIGDTFGAFFAAPTQANGTPVLRYCPETGGPQDVVSYADAVDPQQLTLPIKGSGSYLTFSAMDNGKRYFARWSSGNGVTLLKRAEGDPQDTVNPLRITSAGNNNYFAGTYEANGNVYLIKHAVADDELLTVTVNGQFPTAIGEICAVLALDRRGVTSSSGGTVYFTGNLPGVGNDVLMKIPANSTTGVASLVLSSQSTPVFGARNLHAVSDQTSPAFYRLYFSAPVSSTVNEAFMPEDSPIADFGTKPWVIGEAP